MSKDLTIIFDVGRVLVDFSFTGFEKFLLENGARISSEEFFSKTRIHDYEKGLLTCQEFFQAIEKLLHASISLEEIESNWRNIFTPINEMLSLLEKTSDKHTTYLLSNTNQSHWSYLEDQFGLSKRVDGILTSFEANSMKPEDKIYEIMQQKFQLEGKRPLFIDDLRVNIESANKFGWDTILHKEPEETKRRLEDLGFL